VAGAEGVVTVDVGHRGQRGGEFGVALLLAGIEAEVLQHQHAAVGQCGGLGPGVVADRVGGEGHVLAQQFAQPDGRRLQTELDIAGVALGSAQVAHQDQASAALDDRLDRGHGHSDPPIVGDVLPVVQRHVEINAH